MLLPTILILAALFLIVAILYSCVGHAGASGYLATMALLGIATEVMKPTSLALNILVATIATVQFARAGCFSWRLFWPFAAASIPLAYIGGAIKLPGEYYRPLIGCVLLFSAWRLLATAARPATEPRPPSIPVSLGVGAALAARTAASTSRSSESGTRANTLPVAGSTTSAYVPPCGPTIFPPMKFASVSMG